jgi:hypothetical protein
VYQKNRAFLANKNKFLEPKEKTTFFMGAKENNQNSNQ